MRQIRGAFFWYLNAVNLTSTQSFPPLGEVVLLFFALHTVGAVKL